MKRLTKKCIGYFVIFIIGVIVGNYFLGSYTILFEWPKGTSLPFGTRIGNQQNFYVVKYLRIGGCRIYAPINSSDSELNIYHRDSDLFSSIEINNKGVSVNYHRSSGLAVGGTFYRFGEVPNKYAITYDLLDPSGKVLGYISDFNRDGVQDYKVLVYDDGARFTEYYFVDNAWHEAIYVQGVPSVSINGEPVRVPVIGPKYDLK